MIESYIDADGVERCDNCGEPMGECPCECSDCNEHVTECCCDEGPTYPAVAFRADEE